MYFNRLAYYKLKIFRCIYGYFEWAFNEMETDIIELRRPFVNHLDEEKRRKLEIDAKESHKLHNNIRQICKFKVNDFTSELYDVFWISQKSKVKDRITHISLMAYIIIHYINWKLAWFGGHLEKPIVKGENGNVIRPRNREKFTVDSSRLKERRKDWKINQPIHHFLPIRCIFLCFSGLLLHSQYSMYFQRAQRSWSLVSQSRLMLFSLLFFWPLSCPFSLS